MLKNKSTIYLLAIATLLLTAQCTNTPNTQQQASPALSPKNIPDSTPQKTPTPQRNHTPTLTEQRAEYKSTYINQFKFTYLQQLLKKSYNNSKAIQEVINGDHSGFHEPLITMEDDVLIDSLTTAANNQLKADSAAGINRAEGADGKRPFDFIIQKFTTPWLDSLATARFKKSGQTE